MNITRRIHLNPQSKGNLGKSFEAEFRTAWLDRLGIPWNGPTLMTGIPCKDDIPAVRSYPRAMSMKARQNS
jgi:hypothetical protein